MNFDYLPQVVICVIFIHRITGRRYILRQKKVTWNVYESYWRQALIQKPKTWLVSALSMLWADYDRL